jgi:hypothetical protein
VFALESASFHRSGAKNLEVALKLFKILWIPALDTENVNLQFQVYNFNFILNRFVKLKRLPHPIEGISTLTKVLFTG